MIIVMYSVHLETLTKNGVIVTYFLLNFRFEVMTVPKLLIY